MNSLDLYSIVEEYLGFEEEIGALYQFYIDKTDQYNIDSLIDIGCGQGGFLEALPQTIKTLGIDLSSEQIKVCQKKGLNAKHIDICDVDSKYEMATAVFDVLNYLDKTTLDNFIKCTANILQKNGYFLFDINTLYGFEEIAQGTLNINKEDKFIAIDATYEDKKLITNINLFEKNSDGYKRSENHITQYFHSKETLKKLLKKHNLKIISIEDFYLHSDELADKNIFIAQKIV